MCILLVVKGSCAVRGIKHIKNIQSNKKQKRKEKNWWVDGFNDGSTCDSIRGYQNQTSYKDCQESNMTDFSHCRAVNQHISCTWDFLQTWTPFFTLFPIFKEYREATWKEINIIWLIWQCLRLCYARLNWPLNNRITWSITWLIFLSLLRCLGWLVNVHNDVWEESSLHIAQGKESRWLPIQFLGKLYFWIKLIYFK